MKAGRTEAIAEILYRRFGPISDVMKSRISYSVASDPNARLDTVTIAKFYAAVLPAEDSGWRSQPLANRFM